MQWPTQENPGWVAHGIFATALLGMLLLAIGSGTTHWINIYGKDAVAFGTSKLTSNSSLTIDHLNLIWPEYEARYMNLKTIELQLVQAVPLVSNYASEDPSSGWQVRTGRKRRGIEKSLWRVRLDLAITGKQKSKFPTLSRAVRQTGRGNLTFVQEEIRQIEQINKSRKALNELHDLDLNAGLFEMCGRDENNVRSCGSATSYRNVFLDGKCSTANVELDKTLLTVEDIKAKRRLCNANFLAKAVLEAMAYYGTVMMGIIILNIIPCVLIGTVAFSEKKRGVLFHGILSGVLFIILGIIGVMAISFYNTLMIGGYRRGGMSNTSVGASWVLSLLGALCLTVAGVGCLFIKKSNEVAPLNSSSEMKLKKRVKHSSKKASKEVADETASENL